MGVPVHINIEEIRKPELAVPLLHKALLKQPAVACMFRPCYEARWYRTPMRHRRNKG